MIDAVLTTVRAGTAAVWLGAMLYSLFVVQPGVALGAIADTLE